ncbi:hypothetical protein ACQ4LE_000603 [Meloidogyne hapla]
MYSKRIIQIIVFLHIILAISALVLSEDSNLKSLPEYSEYLRRIGYNKTRDNTGKDIKTTKEPKIKKMESPIAHFSNFPSIQLCKDAPTSGEGFYTNIYCWVMLALYALLILSLIIYQLRSIIWLKSTIPSNKNSVQRVNLCSISIDDDQFADRKNLELKSPNKNQISGLSTM